MMVMNVVCKVENWVKGEKDFNYCARCSWKIPLNKCPTYRGSTVVGVPRFPDIYVAGRVDWLSLEKAFRTKCVELEDGRPSCFRNGEKEGLTREQIFKAGQSYAVPVHRRERKHFGMRIYQ